MHSEAEVAATLGVGASRRRWRRAAWIGAGLTVAGGVAVGIWALTRPTAWIYDTAVVSQGDLVVAVTAVGQLEPLHAVDVSSDTSGTVAQVHVETGDRVAAGQPLATLDQALLRAQAREVSAAHAAAKAAEQQARVVEAGARLDLERARSLHAAKGLADADLDGARLAYDRAVAATLAAKAQVEQTAAAVASARTRLERAVITSPIDGVVLERNVEPGQGVVSALQAATLFRVAEDLGRMSADVAVDEADIGRVQIDQPATFTVSSFPERVFPAVVHKVELAPQPNQAVVTYEACLHLDNAEGLLRPGMTATATIEAERHADVVRVPAAALRFTPDDVDLPAPEPRDGRRVDRVWRLTGAEPEPVEVIVGASDGHHALLVDGPLAVGDRLVIGARDPSGKDDE